MIASTPVARWTWGRSDEAADALVRCLRDLLIAYKVMAVHGLAAGEPAVRVSVAEAGTSNSRLFGEELTVPGAYEVAEAVEQLAARVRSGLRPGEVGSGDASVDCAGVLLTGEGEVLQEGLFRLGASAFADFVSVDLVTFSDAWMPYDLKGRPQPGISEANAPRLAAVLNDLAVALDSETDPDDPTYFGRPTESGVGNFFGADGAASDVWGSFEIPYRNRVFQHAPGFAEPGYKRSADGEVRYVPVHGDHGLLGYLWASDTERAAGFEPRDDADEDGYKAGLLWLDRLRAAHDRGLTPSAALTEASGLPDEAGAGHVDPMAEPRTADLTTLRELAVGG
ncbi:hypothetical protein [Streptomyces sp. NPDC047009]|uniref:hypothetical protein n=1 Tax=Streptomyces sp. NPDC047009 TaxID=3154496 RepID=UPI0033DEED09